MTLPLPFSPTRALEAWRRQRNGFVGHEDVRFLGCGLERFAGLRSEHDVVGVLERLQDGLTRGKVFAASLFRPFVQQLLGGLFGRRDDVGDVAAPDGDRDGLVEDVTHRTNSLQQSASTQADSGGCSFDFGRLLPAHRKPLTYQGTLDLHRRGLLSLGFLWDVARDDEVFAAFLRKHEVERP